MPLLVPPRSHRVVEVFLAFLWLGLCSFGGPIAHLGYFRAAFVDGRKWLDESSYAELVALCQFLPGPTSSQVGFALGLQRAGWAGALAAWLAFTLPSVALLIALAYGLTTAAVPAGAVEGLKLAAVAVVAQAVWQMARSLCPDAARRVVAVCALGLCLALPGPVGQVLAIGAAALIGSMWLHAPAASSEPVPWARHAPLSAAHAALAGVLGLALALPILAAVHGPGIWTLLAGVFRAGALVFGGGHVVLPMLQSATVDAGHLSPTQFLAGYGAAQAVPGPLFTVVAYLGAAMQKPVSGVLGGLLLTVVLFLPGLLLVVAALPYWAKLRQASRARAALAGVNAAVTGLLAAALYQPLWSTAIHDLTDALVAAAACVMLVWWRVPALAVVVACALAGITLAAR